MIFTKQEIYLRDLDAVGNAALPWEKLANSSILVTGATGMIGSFLIDLLMRKSELSVTVYAVSRSMERLSERFSGYLKMPNFRPVICDINTEVPKPAGPVDYILHAASSTHPLQYSGDPIGTVTANIIGTNNLLGLCETHSVKRFLFCSSVEIYGENRGDTDAFSEDYLGYINCNTLRAGYPESKRCGEALCEAYRKQKGTDVVIARLARTYGPTMLLSDSKAISQFIKKSASGEDIVLKSEGTQFYSYTYVADAVLGLLTCLLKGTDGEAYNIAADNGNIALRDLSKILADLAGTRVVFELPDETERAGYSTATRAVLDGSKLAGLGFSPRFTMEEGLSHTRELVALRMREAK